MKIILIIIGALLYTYFLMVISWTNGFMRSLKLMSKKGQKRSKYEKHCIKHVFENKKGDVDPFFQSLYMKEEYKKQTNVLKQKVEEKKEVLKKNKKNVKKTKK